MMATYNDAAFIPEKYGLKLTTIKVKLSLCFSSTEHYAMKAYWGSGSIPLRIILPRH